MYRAVRVILVLLMILALPAWVSAQQSGHQHGQAAPAGKQPAKAASETSTDKGGEAQKMQMMEQCKKDMMGKHDKMVEGMKAMDARLEEKLAAAKNAKTTDEKVSALEAALAEMAAQRKEIHGLMADMHHSGMKCGMMGGMMGGKPPGKESMHHGGGGGMRMSCCSMMEGHEGHGAPSSETPKDDAGMKKE